MFTSHQRVELARSPRTGMTRAALASWSTASRLILLLFLLPTAWSSAQEAAELPEPERTETNAPREDAPSLEDIAPREGTAPVFDVARLSTGHAEAPQSIGDLLMPHLGFWHEWWFSRGDMVPHFGYPVSENSNYYFRPYHFTRVVRQQRTATRWGGNPRHPYDNTLLDRVYEQWAEEQPPEVEEKADEDAPGTLRPEPGAPTPRPAGTPPRPAGTTSRPAGTTMRPRPAETLRTVQRLRPMQTLRPVQATEVVNQTSSLEQWIIVPAR